MVYIQSTFVICYFLTAFQQYKSVITWKNSNFRNLQGENEYISNWRNNSTRGKINGNEKTSKWLNGSSESATEYLFQINESRWKTKRGLPTLTKNKSNNLRIKRSDNLAANNERVSNICQIPRLSCKNLCECEIKKLDLCFDDTICHCDSDCTFYNDCCADYKTFCGYKHQISYGVSQQELSCIELNRPHSIFMHSIWVVNKCPTNRNSDAVTRWCEIADDLQVNITNLQHFVPVFDQNNLIFRNEFCAKCNNIERFKYFSKSIECDIVPPSFIASVIDFAKFVSRYCKIVIQHKHDVLSRRCYLDQKKGSKEKCVSKLYFCQFTYDSRDYYKCLNLLQLSGPIGPGAPAVPTPPFTITFDISKGKAIHSMKKDSCQETREQFYDRYLQICRLGKTLPPLKENLDRYDVVVWLGGSAGKPRVHFDDVILRLAKLFNFKTSQISGPKDVPESYNRFIAGVIRFEIELTDEQILRLGKVNNTNGPSKVLYKNDTNNSSNVFPLRRLLFFTGEFNITIRGVSYAVVKTTSRQLACIRKQIYPPGTYISIKNGKYYYINSTGKMFPENKVFIEDKLNESITVCEQVVPSTCIGRRIYLTSHEYVKFDNLSIFFNRTKTIYEFGEYDIQDGKIIMCILENPSEFLNQSDHPLIESYLTLVCLVLSLAGLFLVIQTYLIFSELRNLPGKNLISFTMSLFFWQLLWLIPDEWFTHVFCHVVAVIRHYLLLVSFVAMSTIAWDTHLTFADTKFQTPRRANKKRENKDFCRYSIMVWGLPAIFVVPCAVVDGMDIYGIYVNEQLCWFENTQPQKYLFVLPVGILLLFNVVFFALTVYAIRRVNFDTRVARVNQSNKSMLWISLKLSSLMGFCWLFGFIHLLVKTSTPIFSYLFIIFASLQGVYIAIAFVMKKQIWEMYKKLCKQNTRKPTFEYSTDFLENLKNSKETML